MSADNITLCPGCKEYTLREWTDVGMSATGYLEIDYYSECKECSFSYRYQDRRDALYEFNRYEEKHNE